jgi:hypothetical protein
VVVVDPLLVMALGFVVCELQLGQLLLVVDSALVRYTLLKAVNLTRDFAPELMAGSTQVRAQNVLVLKMTVVAHFVVADVVGVRALH